MPDLIADVSDGVASFSGNVSDVSRYGMQLDDIPGKFNEKTKTAVNSTFCKWYIL